MARLPHQTGASGKAGETFVHIVPAGGPASHASATPLVVKQFEFNPTDYTLEGATRSLEFVAVAANGTSPLTTHVQLYNLTDGEAIATLNFVDTTTPGSQLAALTEGAGAGEVDQVAKIYEVRVYVDSPATASDTIELGSAELRCVNAIQG